MSDSTSYTIGWICALATELTAARAFLDKEHHPIDIQEPGDHNNYVLGCMGKHNVVIASLPGGEYGTSSAASVAKDMLRSFPNIRVGLMVGIGGGVPTKKNDIRLGDVVVSEPGNGYGGVIQYDFGKAIQEQSFKITSHLNQPPPMLLTAMTTLRSNHEIDGAELEKKVHDALKKKPRLEKNYGHPDPNSDQLYSPHFVHPSDHEVDCIGHCDQEPSHLVDRHLRSKDEDNPAVHYGLIASANSLMKDAGKRDDWAKEEKILCFEMEAAGLMNRFPCLVIRGVCDYADSHKNKVWQCYAAMVAAAYAKDLLLLLTPTKVESEELAKDVLSEIREFRNETQKQYAATVTEIKNKTILEWLKAVDPSNNHNSARQERHGGTGSWLLRSDAFESWKKAENSSCLWLSGTSGCGKTVLVSTAIESLRADRPVALLYFYFTFTEEAKQTTDGMVRSLLKQIVHQQPLCWEELESLYSRKQGNQPSYLDLRDTLTKMIRRLGKVFIVLDALDECMTQSGHESLLIWIGYIMHETQSTVHLLVTSQQTYDIEKAIMALDSSKQNVLLQKELIQDDIRAYVQYRIRNDQELKRWQSRPEVEKEIETRILDGADEMFRLVAGRLDGIQECLDLPQLQDKLQRLPVTLNDNYNQILCRIPEGWKKGAILILQFLLHSSRPLTISELVDALAVNTDQKPYFSAERRMPDYLEVRRYCFGLVVLAEQDWGSIVSERLGTSKESDALKQSESSLSHLTLRLAHSSVKDYLISNQVLHEDFRNHFGESSRRILAKICLRYLSCIRQKSSFQAIEKEFPFAQYSAETWMTNATFERKEKDELHQVIMTFLVKDTQPYANWYLLYDPDQPLDKPPRNIPLQASPLYYASLGGLIYETQGILRTGANVNAQGGDYGTALQAASANGHQTIVQALLDHQADVNLQGGHHGTALQAASANGHQTIVQTLLNYHADVNAHSGDFSTALRVASANGHQTIVQVLLDHHADVNFQSKYFAPALQVASANGHQTIVQTLLDHQADVNLRSEHYSTALQEASAKGHQTIVQTLLDHHADVNLQSGHHGTALQAASANGNQTIVQTLLDYHADINLQSGYYGTALYIASAHGYQTIVQTLLDHQADVNLQSGHHGTALQEASANGHQTIVQTLLDHQADVNAHSGDFGTGLQVASAKGHQTIVQILLDHQADVNFQSGHHGTALQEASANGHQTIVQTLLNYHADVNAYSGDFSTALQAASAKGHQTIVQTLLDHQADVNFQSRHHSTALQEASAKGHQTIVQTLLDYQADVNLQSEYFATALYTASANRYQTIVQTLLDHHANVNFQSEYFGTGLQVASAKGHQTIVQILLDHQADVNFQSGHHGTALQEASANGHQTIVQTLLDHNADVNLQGGHYDTALQAASANGHQTIVQTLLNYHADVNAHSGDFSTALQAASAEGHQTIVQTLLDYQADVNLQSEYFGTALQVASAKGHQTIVQTLLDHQADVNLQSEYFAPALQVASANRHQTIVQTLLDYHADVNAYSGDFSTALQVASAEGHQTIVQTLLDYHADVNAHRGDFGTALQAASAEGHQTIVQTLLDHHANVNLQGGYYDTALQAASANGHQTIVQTLLDHHANVNLRGGYYDTALQAASAKGHQTIVQTLLDHQAGANLKCGSLGKEMTTQKLENKTSASLSSCKRKNHQI